MPGAVRSDRPHLREFHDLPAIPWFITPFLRSLPSSREMLTLSTFQTREAYAWMSRAMEDRRVPGPTDGMMWLWPHPTRRRIRSHAKQASGDVLLTVRVPHEWVVISEFADWHFALNRMLHVPQRVGESYETWDARWSRVWGQFKARVGDLDRRPSAEWPPELRDELENSWEAIFDPATWQPDSTLQATMRRLRTEDVVGAVRIR